MLTMMPDSPSAFTEAQQRILEDRARRLAQPPTAPITGEMMELVILALGAERYGVDVRFIQEVQPLDNLTPLPGVPAFWVGLVNLRGHLYPVLDLRNLLGLPPRPAAGQGEAEPPPAKVVLAVTKGLEICLLADDVPEVRQVLKAEIGVPLIEVTGPVRTLTAGVTSDLLTVLNIEALLTDARLAVQVS